MSKVVSKPSDIKIGWCKIFFVVVVVVAIVERDRDLGIETTTAEE